MRPKSLIQTTLGRVGYVLTKTPVEGSLARQIQRAIADRDIDTVLDVGAHEGRYGRMLRSIGFAGQIIGFEPSESPFRRLEAMLDANWEVHRLALGDRDGVADLYEYKKHEELASLRRPSRLGREWGMGPARKVQVRVCRLDEVVRELGVHPGTTLLKIDTQGHDRAVLDGGAQFVRELAALQVELPMFVQYEGTPRGTELLEHVLSLGFDLVGLYPVHNYPPLVPVEFDALFTKSRAR